MSNIHPIDDRQVSRDAKERLLNQKGMVLWLTGLSGSGKSTIALELERQLQAKGLYSMLLDGDNVRTGLCNNLGFSLDDRAENIRRISEVAKLFCGNGAIVICSFVSPTVSIRKQAEDVIGSSDFNGIFIDTPLEICEQRDVKGLYKLAREGKIKNFTGIDSPFEVPSGYLVIETKKISVSSCAELILDKILKQLTT